MKCITKTMMISLLIVTASCNAKNLKENTQQNDPITSMSKTSNQETSKNDISNETKKYTPDKLYSIFESKMDSLNSLLSKASSKNKENINSDGTKEEFICFYLQNKLISATKRLYANNKKIAMWSYSFENDNNCCMFTVKEKGNADSQEYLSWNGLVINSNSSLQSSIIDKSTMQPILVSAKATLTTIMAHFPEFKYSFNWE